MEAPGLSFTLRIQALLVTNFKKCKTFFLGYNFLEIYLQSVKIHVQKYLNI